MSAGRPKTSLTAKRRGQLRRALTRVQTAELRLDSANSALALTITAAREEGTSLQVIADELGLAKSTVWKIVRENTFE